VGILSDYRHVFKIPAGIGTSRHGLREDSRGRYNNKNELFPLSIPRLDDDHTLVVAGSGTNRYRINHRLDN